MFGFKHTLNKFNHNEAKLIRSRLYGRLLHVQGPEILAGLYPYIQKKLTSSLEEELQAAQPAGPGRHHFRADAEAGLS